MPGCGDSATYADLIKGLDWIKKHVVKFPAPSVVTMSLTIGSVFADELVELVQDLLELNVSVVAAAGNQAGGVISASFFKIK